MGGSMGYALKESGRYAKISGCDNNPYHQNRALELGIVDEIISFEACKESDIIILSTPVNTIASLLKNLQDVNAQTTIIDLGSTKEELIKMTPPVIRTNYVPTHPMCGTEKHGPDAAIKGLYKNKIVVFCDTDRSGESQLNDAKTLYEAIGSKIVYMHAKDHDLHAAFISHLPHAISFALANSVLKQEDPRSIVNLAAGGFKDMSRVAKSSPVMWSDIFRQNKTFLLASLDAYLDELNVLKERIKEEDWDKVEKFIEDANKLQEIL